MPAIDNDDDEQDASLTSNQIANPKITKPSPGRIGEVFKGVANVTREFERCRHGSKVVERLIYGGMVCFVIVTYIRYGH